MRRVSTPGIRSRGAPRRAPLCWFRSIGRLGSAVRPIRGGLGRKPQRARTKESSTHVLLDKSIVVSDGRVGAAAPAGGSRAVRSSHLADQRPQFDTTSVPCECEGERQRPLQKSVQNYQNQKVRHRSFVLPSSIRFVTYGALGATRTQTTPRPPPPSRTAAAWGRARRSTPAETRRPCGASLGTRRR